MAEDVSPEEKLLNLIKGGREPAAKEEIPSRAAAPPAVSAEGNGGGKGPGQKRRISRKVRKKKKGSANPFLLVNRFLLLGMLAVLAYMVLGYIYRYRPGVDIPEKFEIISGKEAGDGLEGLPPLSNYTKVIGRRQIFKVFEPPKPKSVTPPKPRVTLQQLLGGYTFVGIIFGESPQAIVEEKRSKQSYYLNAGQYLGEIKIEKIERSKVTVSYDGETMEIRI